MGFSNRYVRVFVKDNQYQYEVSGFLRNEEYSPRAEEGGEEKVSEISEMGYMERGFRFHHERVQTYLISYGPLKH